VLSEKFANPAILAFVRADDDDEVVAGDVVRVEQIGDDVVKSKAAGDYQESVFFA
jgi:hypothetical protein